MSVWNNIPVPTNLKIRHAQVQVWFNDAVDIAKADVRSGYESQKRPTVMDIVMPGGGETGKMEYAMSTLGALPGDVSSGSMAVYTAGAVSVESTAMPNGFILRVHADDLADDRFGIIQGSINKMSLKTVNWTYQKIAESLIDGLTKTTVDGKAFFATDHHVNLIDASNGSYSNKLSLALTADNFSTAYSTFQTIPQEDGKPDHSNVPDTLIVPANLVQTAVNIVAMPKVFGGADNPYYGLCKIVRVPEWDLLSSGAYKNSWILARTGSSLVKPFIWNEREKLSINYIGARQAGPLPGLYHEWMVYGRMALAFYEPRYAIYSAP
jgi:hypothetical protein